MVLLGVVAALNLLLLALRLWKQRLEGGGQATAVPLGASA
jgi:hypothetical protein